jgi:hypothetical protein
MYAFKGDRIIVRDDDTVREAEVVSGTHDDGHPPYWVRWDDSVHDTLVFPPIDAEVEHAGPTYPPEYDA